MKLLSKMKDDGNIEDHSEFKSNDFYLCACVLASGIPLKRVERGDGKFMVFVFDDPECKAEQIISDHWDRKLRVPTRQLIDAIHELKTRLHAERRPL